MYFPPSFIVGHDKGDRSENGFWIAHQQPATTLMKLYLCFHLATFPLHHIS